MFARSTVILIACLSVSACQNSPVLPPIPNSTEVRLRSQELGELVITEPRTVEAVRTFANEFKDGWGVPWYGPPVSRLLIDFYAGSTFVGNFGVSNNFVTRTYGEFWSQRVSEKTLKAFAVRTHLAIQEAVFLEELTDQESKELLQRWETKLSELQPGKGWPEVGDFLKANAIQIAYVSGNDPKFGSFRNLVLQTVHEGRYVNTVIAAQLQLNFDLTLNRVRFFGYQHAKK
jgi:hypothetical protein